MTPNDSKLADDRLLEVSDLEKHFPIKQGFLKKEVGRIRAVDGVNFHIEDGETLGLVGESGCGKTTTARCILRAVDPTNGEILFRTQEDEVVDIASMKGSELKKIRSEIQMIFQDPFSSLNPRMTLLDTIGEPLLLNNIGTKTDRVQRVADLFDMVGLRPEYMRRFPHAFSGGQRQRIGIARALALNPKLLLADEPVSALDVSVQAQIINLLEDLQEELGLTYLFVAHDLAVVRHICDRVLVMRNGKVVERGNVEKVFSEPQENYTKLLLSAIPSPDPDIKLNPLDRKSLGLE